MLPPDGPREHVQRRRPQRAAGDHAREMQRARGRCRFRQAEEKKQRRSHAQARVRSPR